MKLNTVMRILSFIVNSGATILLLEGVGKLSIMFIIIIVALINYLTGFTFKDES